MSDGVTFKVRNKDRLLKKLGQSVPAVFEALATANHQSADEMVDLARSFVAKKTGRLAQSIVATPPGGTPPAYSQGGGGTVPEGAYAVSAGNSKVRYAHLVEYGTAPHILGGLFKGAQHPGSRAQPFFWPAYRLIRKAHRRAAGKAIRTSIKKVFGS